VLAEAGSAEHGDDGQEVAGGGEQGQDRGHELLHLAAGPDRVEADELAH